MIVVVIPKLQVETPSDIISNDPYHYDYKRSKYFFVFGRKETTKIVKPHNQMTNTMHANQETSNNRSTP